MQSCEEKLSPGEKKTLPKENATFYVRSYAVNSRGTSYRNEISFTTASSLLNGPVNFNPDLTYGTVSDIESNSFKIVKIGAQTWMAENLKTTRFNDGESIPLVMDNNSWSKLLTPGFSWYNNDPEKYKNEYGALYNWYAAASGKLCPAGWKVPDESDFVELYNYLGANTIAGGKMKETGTTHWL